MSRTSDLKDQDPRVFRIHMQDQGVREITAAYYQHEHGFVAFKDNDGQAAYAVREDLVAEVQRLRTHVILAIASEELELILGALGERAAQLGTDPRDSFTAREAEQLTALAESLTRLRPIAAIRDAEDPSSLPRTRSRCTCQFTANENGGTTLLNPGCEVHRTTSNAVAA